MESFETFLERSVQPAVKPLPFTRGTVMYSNSINMDEHTWKTFSEFPELFNDKLLVIQDGMTDPRKKLINQQFARIAFSLCAAFLGYSPSGRGHKMPKTRLVLDFTGYKRFQIEYIDAEGSQDSGVILAVDKESAVEFATEYYKAQKILNAKAYGYAGTHSHERSHSWSHTIKMNMSVAAAHGDLSRYVTTLTHEMIHALQVTHRRMTTSKSGQLMWDRQAVELVAPEDDREGYMNSPWEVEAHKKAPEVAADIMSYLRSGVAKGGFNPKRI